MICISSNCPRYSECGMTVQHTQFEDCEDLYSFGYGIISKDKTEFHHECGPFSDYKLFFKKGDLLWLISK